MNQCTVCKVGGGFLHCGCPLSLRIQHDRSVDQTRIRVPKGETLTISGIPPFSAPSPTPQPADLAADVLDAMTRKLADYDRLSAALTSAQEAATKNLERAALAEDERNSYRVAAESDAKEVDDVREVLRAASGEGAADAAARVMRELDEARSLGERLGEAFDCHPGELPRVGKSLSGAMARIAKCVEKVGADDDEIADAVEQLSEGRNKMRAHLDDCDSKLTAMRVALSKAGIPEVEKYPDVPTDPYERSLRAGGRVLGGVERIERLQSQRDRAMYLAAEVTKERDDYQAAAEAEAEEVDRRGALLHRLLTFVRECRKEHEFRRKAGLFGGDNIIDAEIHELREMNRALCDKVEELCSGVRSPRRRHEKLKAEVTARGAGGFTPREWNEKVKAKLHDIDFDINEAKAINGDCAIGTPRPGPKLTPLRAVGVHQRNGTGWEWVVHFVGDMRLSFSYADLRVGAWELSVPGHLMRVEYINAAPHFEALADVNAILARYDYVLEAWP